MHAPTPLGSQISVVLIAILFSYVVHRFHFFYIPESAFTMALGALAGVVATIAITDPAEREAIQFYPELFFFLLLPPIIFEAGFNLKVRRPS